MKTSPNDVTAGALWQRLTAAGASGGRTLSGPTDTVALDALATGSAIAADLATLAGSSLLLLTRGQLASALALIELDGVARRIVLAPPDLDAAHVPHIAAAAEIDTIVTDQASAGLAGGSPARRVVCGTEIAPAAVARTAVHDTEWVLLTSGTTGVPKLVVHTLHSLTGAITGAGALGPRAVWSTFYDIRRYGGLQIFLRAMLGGGSMVLSDAAEPVGDFLARAGQRGVTHISGTPSHWRRVLMSSAARQIAPGYARLSGEIADQAVLDRLRACYPEADIAHAFATTEAGVAFAVGDGGAGFPATLIGAAGAVELKIVDGSLRIRSPRTARRYLGADAAPLADADGFVDTGDMIEERDGRCYFVGRRNGVINVGGLKVHPEEVEAVLHRHPLVRMALVAARKSPITGAIVSADIVPADATALPEAELTRDIAAFCRRELAAHKVPAVIRVVPTLPVGAAGKLARRDA